LNLECEALLPGIVGKSTAREIYPVKFGKSMVRLLIVWNCTESALQSSGLHFFIPVTLRNAKNFMSFRGIVVKRTQDQKGEYSRVACFETLWDKQPVNFKRVIDRFKSIGPSDQTDFIEVRTRVENEPTRFIINPI
jgi:hypothetical protein